MSLCAAVHDVNHCREKLDAIKATLVVTPGDATVGTAAKGKVISDEANSRLGDRVADWHAWPLTACRDFHTNPVRSRVRW